MKLKKLLALLLALVMVFALAACGDDVSNDDDDDDDDDEESTSMSSDPTGTTGGDKLPGDAGGNEDSKNPIVGNGEPVGPAVPVVDPIVGLWETSVETTGATMGVAGFNGVFNLVIDLIFDADGDYRMDVNEDKTLASMDAAFDKALADYVFDNLMTMVESEEEADALCQDQYGVNAREFSESCVPELKDMLKEMMLEMVTIGKYEQEDGKLYLDGQEVAFSKEGETLKLSTANLDMENVGAEELVFHLVSADSEDVGSADKDEEEEVLRPVAEAIVGQWEMVLFQDGEDIGLDDFDGLMAYEFDFAFKADGTFSMKPNSEAILESAELFEEEMVKYLVNMLYAQLTEDGSTKEEADQFMIDEYGQNVVEYAQAQVANYDMVGQMTEVLEQMDMDLSGTYSITGNKLVLNADGEKLEFAFELMDNDCFQLDGTDTQFEVLLNMLGEESMVLFREDTV